MNQTAHDINARGQRAVEAHARAETDEVFDAAAALLDAAPERARPSSWRRGRDGYSTSHHLEVDHLGRGGCDRGLQLSSSGGMHRRRTCGCRTLEPPHSAFDSIIGCRASALRRCHKPAPGATLPSKPCFCYYFPCKVLLPPQAAFDRASCNTPGGGGTTHHWCGGV